MDSQNNTPIERTITVDNQTFQLLMDSSANYEQFTTQILNNKIIRKKFLLLAGLNNKLTRLEDIDKTLIVLCEKINSEIENMSTEDAMKYFEMLSNTYSSDVSQLRIMFADFIKLLQK